MIKCSGHATAQRSQAMHKDSFVSGFTPSRGAPRNRSAICGRSNGYCSVISCFGDWLRNVTPRPLSRSTNSILRTNCFILAPSLAEFSIGLPFPAPGRRQQQSHWLRIASRMRIVTGIVLTLALTVVLGAQEPTGTAPPKEAGASQVADRTPDPKAATSIKGPLEAQATTDPAEQASTILPAPPSPQIVAEAKKQFKAGVRLKSAGKTEAAFEKFEQASQTDPRNLEYV